MFLYFYAQINISWAEKVFPMRYCLNGKSCLKFFIHCGFLINPHIGLFVHVTSLLKNISCPIYSRKNFLTDIIYSFVISNTKYINFLRVHCLTRTEINHCCLLTLELNSKEAGILSQNRNHYNLSSNIRSKFGLSSNGINLNIFLKKLYEECQYETSSLAAPEMKRLLRLTLT